MSREELEMLTHILEVTEEREVQPAPPSNIVIIQ